MKSILLSIKPKYVELIARREKTIEVRKSAPKEVPFKAYIYCTKVKSQRRYRYYEGAYENSKGEIVYAQQHVIGEFICDEVEEFHEWELSPQGKFADFERERLENFLTAACLSEEEVVRYRENLPYYKPLYGWHMSNLKIYDKPKELSDFCIPCKTNCEDCKKPLFYDCWKEKGKIKVVTRPPQSYMFVEEVE